MEEKLSLNMILVSRYCGRAILLVDDSTVTAIRWLASIRHVALVLRVPDGLVCHLFRGLHMVIGSTPDGFLGLLRVA